MLAWVPVQFICQSILLLLLVWTICRYAGINETRICVISNSESQISIHFIPWPAVLEVFFTGHFETSAPNDPKMQNDLEHYKVHVLLVSPSHTNFSAFHSTTIHFRVTGHFETSGSNNLKITLNNYKIKYTHLFLVSLSLKFQFCYTSSS